MQNHLSKPAPGPPSIFDERVSCTAPATRNAPWLILFNCPRPAIVFGNAAKPLRIAHFWQGADSLAPAARKHIITSKSGQGPSVFNTFDVQICFVPQRRARFQHRNFQKRSDVELLCTFDFGMCFATKWRAHFQHLIFQKCSGVGVLCTFWLCFAAKKRTHFLDSSILERAPKLRCFAHFDLEICFRATAACNFSCRIWRDGSAPAALKSLNVRPSKATNN